VLTGKPSIVVVVYARHILQYRYSSPKHRHHTA